MQRSAIALLITLMFIMAITVSIGVGLKYVNDASKEIEGENFMLQSSVIVEDVLSILKNHPDLQEIKDQEALFTFLAQTSYIPFESSGVRVLLKFSSARAKFNINTLNAQNRSSFDLYLSNKMINIVYTDILLDSIGGIKEDFSYNTQIFNDKPFLFRDYIASQEHLDEINTYFMQNYHENINNNIDFENLLYFSDDKNTSIDANHATKEVWQLLLGTDELRGEELMLNAGAYTDKESLNLSPEEDLSFSKFKVGFFEPFIDVKVKIMQNDKTSNIRFEYDILNKKGSNFSYDI